MTRKFTPCGVHPVKLSSIHKLVPFSYQFLQHAKVHMYIYIYIHISYTCTFGHNMHSSHIHMLYIFYVIYRNRCLMVFAETSISIQISRHINPRQTLWAITTMYKLHTNCHTISEHPEMPPVLDVPEMLMQPEEVRGVCVARVVWLGPEVSKLGLKTNTQPPLPLESHQDPYHSVATPIEFSVQNGHLGLTLLSEDGHAARVFVGVA